MTDSKLGKLLFWRNVEEEWSLFLGFQIGLTIFAILYLFEVIPN